MDLQLACNTREQKRTDVNAFVNNVLNKAQETVKSGLELLRVSTLKYMLVSLESKRMLTGQIREPEFDRLSLEPVLQKSSKNQFRQFVNQSSQKRNPPAA